MRESPLTHVVITELLVWSRELRESWLTGTVIIPTPDQLLLQLEAQLHKRLIEL